MASKAKDAAQHPLAKGEKIIAQNGDVAVTSVGRKVVLDSLGGVKERLTGPLYAWEISASKPEPEPEDK